MASISTLTDAFTGTNAQWTYNTAAAVTGGQLVCQCLSSYAGEAHSASTYDLTGGAFLFEMPTVPAVGNGTTETYSLAYLSDPNTNAVGWNLAGDSLRAISRVSGSSTNVATAPYSATDHRWLRVAESGGTITWSASADAINWSPFATLSNPITITALAVILGTGYFGTETAPGTAAWDNVNLAPASSVTLRIPMQPIQVP